MAIEVAITFKKNYISKKIKKVSVEILIFFAKFLIFLKRLTAAFFVNFILKPGRFFLRFGFYKIVVKIYKFYLYGIKRLNLIPSKSGNFFAVLSQKSVHVVVIILTVLLVFTNFTSKTKAEVLAEKATRTILADLIKNEFNSLEEERLIEEFFDEEATISPTQQNYLDNLTSVKAEPRVLIGSFNEEMDEGVGIITQGGGALIKPGIASTNKTKRPRTNTIEYIVEVGDSISTIAENFGISVNTILWENKLSSYSVIRPGNKLTILPVSGVTHKVLKGENLSTIARKYNIEESKIIEKNKLTDSSRLSIGQKLIIPGGKKTRYTSSRSTRYSGVSAIRDLVKSSGATPISGNTMNWPTRGSRITQYYSWRHYALDIANKSGTPIYAADAGTIETAGWGKGYGYQVVINHGGGKKTRYAHLSKFYVERGDKIGKGETIAAMGSTGWSTGPHLHFEVIIGGKKYNPLNYIK